MKTFSVGEIHPLHLTGLAVGGEAVGRLDEMAVFVPFGTPGDDIEVRLVEVKKNYARGEIERIVRSSAHRTRPPCPIFYRCGGCQLQQMTYGAQLIYKRRMLEEVLHHIGNLRDIHVEDVIECPSPWNYRNKMQVVASSKPFLHSEKRSPYFGLYARQTHQVIRMDECIIQHPLSNQVLKVVKDAITKLQWEMYDEQTNRGLLRHMVTRISDSSNEIMLILVVTSDRIPNLAEFVNMVTRKIPQLSGIAVNINDKKTNVILGPTTKTVWGEDHLIEELDGVKYRISPNSFFQVNPVQTSRLFSVMENCLEPLERDVILDAYAGVGAISLWLARKVRSVIAIEEIMQAKKDALLSAEMNEIGNMEFHVGKVEKILPELYHKGYHIDKIVLDPPRKGVDEKVIDLVSKMRIKRLVYVSCNPATLARDLANLKESGYKIDSVVPLDMFPQTYHVETVVKLSHLPTSFLRSVMKRMPARIGPKDPYKTNILDDGKERTAPPRVPILDELPQGVTPVDFDRMSDEAEDPGLKNKPKSLMKDSKQLLDRRKRDGAVRETPGNRKELKGKGDSTNKLTLDYPSKWSGARKKSSGKTGDSKDEGSPGSPSKRFEKKKKDISSSEKDVPGKPTLKKSSSDKPSFSKPSLDKPSPGKPASGKPVSGKSVSGKTSSNKPVSGKPSSGKPPSGKPSSGKPSSGKPSSGKPSPGKPSAGKQKKKKSSKKDQR